MEISSLDVGVNVRIIKTRTGNMMILMDSNNIIIYFCKFPIFSFFFFAKYTYFSKYRVIAQSRANNALKIFDLLKSTLLIDSHLTNILARCYFMIYLQLLILTSWKMTKCRLDYSLFLSRSVWIRARACVCVCIRIHVCTIVDRCIFIFASRLSFFFFFFSRQ